MPRIKYLLLHSSFAVVGISLCHKVILLLVLVFLSRFTFGIFIREVWILFDLDPIGDINALLFRSFGFPTVFCLHLE